MGEAESSFGAGNRTLEVAGGGTQTAGVGLQEVQQLDPERVQLNAEQQDFGKERLSNRVEQDVQGDIAESRSAATGTGSAKGEVQRGHRPTQERSMSQSFFMLRQNDLAKQSQESTL